MGQKHGEQQRPCCQKTKSEMGIFGKEQTRTT
jgi:hypothetical protein